MNTAPATSLSAILPSSADKKGTITAKEELSDNSTSFKDNLKRAEDKKSPADSDKPVNEKAAQDSKSTPQAEQDKSSVSRSEKNTPKSVDDKVATSTNSTELEAGALSSTALSTQQVEDASLLTVNDLPQALQEPTALESSADLGDINSLLAEEGTENIAVVGQLSTELETLKESSSTLFSPTASAAGTESAKINLTTQPSSQNLTALNNLSLSTELPLALSEAFIKGNQQRQSLVDNQVSLTPSTLSSAIDVDTQQSVNPLSAQIRLAGETAQASPLTTTPNFYSPKWQESVTDKVMWMSAKGLKEATIQLDPPELGHMTIKVAVVQEQAQVSFTVQNASVREALDSHAIRLREMFAEEGIDLADVDVSDQSQSQQQEDMSESDQRATAERNSEGVAQSETDSLSVSVSSISRSLIDSYV